jgi:poly(A) polymerase Pap1
MWTATFVSLFFIGIVVSVHEYLEYRKQKEAHKQVELRYFYKLLADYDKSNNPDVEVFQRLLNKSAKRVSVYYPGFTAPNLL